MPHSATENANIDSGLVCTIILAGVHGIPADPQQLRHEFAASGETFENREILRAAKLLGLKVRAVTSRWDRLCKLTLPAIARHKDGHYFVLGKVDDDLVLIQDPLEQRPLSLPRELFEQAWSGELILFTRRVGILDELRKFDFSWFIPEILKHRKLIGEVLLASFFIQTLALVTPLFFQVIFRYQPDAPEVLRRVSLDVAPGQVIGIVGRSGSGKSTLTKLIQRMHVPESGRVLIDGVDLALVLLQGYKSGFSWPVSVQDKARLAANGRCPLQEAERSHGC